IRSACRRSGSAHAQDLPPKSEALERTALPLRRRRLTVVVVAPADDRLRAVVANRAGVPPARGDLREGSGRRRRLPPLVGAPADDLSLRRQRAAVRIADRDLGEGPRRRRAAAPYPGTPAR